MKMSRRSFEVIFWHENTKIVLLFCFFLSFISVSFWYQDYVYTGVCCCFEAKIVSQKWIFAKIDPKWAPKKKY